MKIKYGTKSIILGALILGLAGFGITQAAPPQMPELFYGSASLDGAPLQAGSVIVAKTADNIEKGRITTTESGGYGGSDAYASKLMVQGDIPQGATIKFFTGSAEATQTALFESNAVTLFNLTFITPVQTQTAQTQTQNQSVGGSGGSSSGGGGGGGGGGGDSLLNQSDSSSIRQRLDANKDGKIDVLDFNALIVNWGKTGSGNLADFNDDGKVDILDFNLIMINWLK